MTKEKDYQSDGPQNTVDEFGDLDIQPIPNSIPWPLLLQVSGLYEWSFKLARPQPLQPVPKPVIPTAPVLDDDTSIEQAVDAEAEETSEAAWYPYWFGREELRLDVDGRYPQMTASGTLYRGLTTRVHWIAQLVKTGKYQWSGKIWYKHGNTASLPQTQVNIVAIPSWYVNQKKVTVTFSGGGASTRKLTYKFKSRYFHPVEFEFDTVTGATATTAINTDDHPNRPASLPAETLTIENVFRRTGFNVKKSGGDSPIPLADAGGNGTWSDMEMHDAMQAHWSRFAAQSQWSMWVLFAATHDQGNGLGGVMFDDIGPNHRQGTAIFSNSFIANPPAGDPAPNAWVERMRFWTAVHEMGHAFNLAHSWQKSHPSSWGTSWIPLANENEERSFMNYPYNVSGGQSSFFSDFEFRFSDSELLFTRHAPAEFVQMGNADWFDNHGFQQANISPEPKFELEVRVNRDKPYFEFLEPIHLELKLKNISSQIHVVDENILTANDDMTVIIKQQSKPARQWAPYARYCHEHRPVALQSGNAIYHSLFISAGQNGWDLAEPGVYDIQVAIHYGEEDIVSNVLKLKILPTKSYDEEYLAQDYFCEDVGRILTFNGSLFLDAGNDTLREVIDRLPTNKAASHAQVALGNPMTCNYKMLDPDKSVGFKIIEAKVDDADKALSAALIDNASEVVETFGHINYKKLVDRFSKFLAAQGDQSAAGKCQLAMHKVLSARNVLEDVLLEIDHTCQQYQGGKKSAAKKVAEEA